MEDINIIFKQSDGKEYVFNTSLIDEDALRMQCGLEPKEQD